MFLKKREGRPLTYGERRENIAYRRGSAAKTPVALQFATGNPRET